MIEATASFDLKALALYTVVKVPVPMSELSGIWISPTSISGLPPNCWCFISGIYPSSDAKPTRKGDGQRRVGEHGGNEYSGAQGYGSVRGRSSCREVFGELLEEVVQRRLHRRG